MTVLEKAFIDSNITLYLIDSDSSLKKEKVEAFLEPHFIISTQVVAENVSVCLRKLKLTKKQSFHFAKLLLKRFKTVMITPAILLKSFEISINYQISSWDALILSTALANDCNILYSEDMQDGLMIERKLKIVNPFVHVK